MLLAQFPLAVLAFSPDIMKLMEAAFILCGVYRESSGCVHCQPVADSVCVFRPPSHHLHHLLLGQRDSGDRP